MSDQDALINKHRPALFKHILGQDEVVASLKQVLDKKLSRAFLFTGPAGTGKTTLARIVAKKVGCLDRNIREVNGAKTNGVDDMRELIEATGFAALGGNPARFFIVDEAHRVSSPAWSTLLKPIEEPPAHVYWAFCTTEPAKVPEAIRTRCSCYTLLPVDPDTLFTLLKDVAAKEKMSASEDVLYYIASHVHGSPRDALRALAQCGECKSTKEAARLIREIDDSDNPEIKQLCQLLLKGTTWERAIEVVKRIEDPNAESVRIVVCNYFSKVALGAESEGKAGRAVELIDAFLDPYPAQSGLAPLLVSLGRLLLK